MTTFYDNFTNACVKAGKKPSPLLQELKISTGALNRWRNGTSPTSDTISKIAVALNVSTDYLITGKEKTAVPEGGDSEQLQEAYELLAGLDNQQLSTVVKMLKAFTSRR